MPPGVCKSVKVSGIELKAISLSKIFHKCLVGIAVFSSEMKIHVGNPYPDFKIAIKRMNQMSHYGRVHSSAYSQKNIVLSRVPALFLVSAYSVGETKAENFLELDTRTFVPLLAGNLDLVVVYEVGPQRCLEVLVEIVVSLHIPVNNNI